jgi:hypothetical protein
MGIREQKKRRKSTNESSTRVASILDVNRIPRGDVDNVVRFGGVEECLAVTHIGTEKGPLGVGALWRLNFEKDTTEESGGTSFPNIILTLENLIVGLGKGAKKNVAGVLKIAHLGRVVVHILVISGNSSLRGIECARTPIAAVGQSDPRPILKQPYFKPVRYRVAISSVESNIIIIRKIHSMRLSMKIFKIRTLRQKLSKKCPFVFGREKNDAELRPR